MSLARLGRVAAREIYRDRHRRALAEHGPTDPRTRALHGRLRVYLGYVPSRESLEIEAVAWRREKKEPQNMNRRQKRELHRRIAAIVNSAGKAA